MTDARGLVETLRKTTAGEVRDDSGTRELYATDASLYRRLPLAALRAASIDDLEAALAACRDHGIALTMRGAGTSLAGQTVGPGLIVDCTSLRSVSIDPESRTAHVQPGVVLDQLNAAAAEHGLTFGPDVATASRATLGGMIANNSAGARSIAYGLTANAVDTLEVIFADGTRSVARRGSPAPGPLAPAADLARCGEPPRLLRRVSGYNLDALASDEPDWARLLCGSEGTLAVTIGATLRLEPLPERRGLAIYRYRTVDEALDAVADLLPTEPSAIELLDRAMVDPRNRAPATASLTAFADRADAMLVVEYQGPSERVGERLAGATGALIVDDPAEQAAVWQVRRSGIARALGLARGDAKPLAFIEDPAVPPDRLASFAKAVRAVLAREELPATWYGHASVGCLHIRPMLDLRAPGAVATMRRVAEAVADLVVAHGGSLSGEHGDGRLRGELLPKMYRPETIQAFAALKRLADPDRLLNPGVIVDPEPLDANLRLAASPPLAAHRTALNFAAEGGLARAAEACTNNGACRADAGAMCPSFQALGDERHSTRGRAVLLRAALEGKLEGGLANPDLHEALDLCLGCKACKSDCPAGVDMARLKIEALAHRRHRSLTGHAHRLLAAASRMPHLAGAIGATVSRLRGVPVPQPRRAWTASPTANLGDPFTLFADTFTRFLHPDLGDDAIRVLEATGANVRVVAPGCCGRPLLSQGRVAAARRTLTATLAGLTDATGPIVVLEPSCWSMFTDDATTLLDRTDLLATAANIRLFEEVVAQRGGPFGEVDTPGVVHPHCHVRALGAAALALDPIARVAERSRLSSAGCCGMAGAFGYSHPRESKLIGRQALARLAPGRGEQIVAAGTSCRAQFTHLTGQVAQHPATFLARGLAD